MASMYKLSRLLVGHTSDVRCVDISDDGKLIASVGRDKLCKLWRYEDGEYFNYSTFEVGANYAISIKFFIRDNFKRIILGGLDQVVKIYDAGTGDLISSLKGHTNAISCISTIQDFILTGSWDFSIKKWSCDGVELNTFQYHSAAVWCMCPVNNNFLTGSADFNIVLWENELPSKSFFGHEAPVRALCVLKTNCEFISCSNDGTIRLWQIATGSCVNILKGHSHFIYSMCTIPFYFYSFISAGEENCVKIWKDCKVVGEIVVPGISNWCVKVLPNLDIIVGSSHKDIMIFTTDPQRTASDEVLAEFHSIISDSNKGAVFNSIDASLLPTVDEGIAKPGTREGQTLVLRDGDQVVIYEWSMGKKEWIFVGNAIRELDKDEKHSSKIRFEGVEYDYVIDVELENGRKLKLPCNLGDDPNDVATKFLNRNNLDQFFFDQVVEFIKKNIPNISTYKKAPSELKTSLPNKSFILFNKTNIDGLFNRLRSGPDSSFLESDLVVLKKYVQASIDGGSVEFAESSFPLHVFQGLFSYSPEDKLLLPVMDLVKQLTLLEPFFRLFFMARNNMQNLGPIDYLKYFLDERYDEKCQMVAIRTFSNIFNHSEYGHVHLENLAHIIDLVELPQLWTSDSISLSTSTILFNYSALFHVLNFKDSSLCNRFCCLTLWVMDAFGCNLNEECINRLITSLGNLVYLNDSGLNSQDFDAIRRIINSVSPNIQKIQDIKKEILKKL